MNSVLLGVLQCLILAGNQSDQSGAHTTAVLGDANADLRLTSRSDSRDLAKSLPQIAFEVGVELDHTAVDTDVNHVVGLELAGVDEDGGQWDGAEPGSALANGVNENLHGLTFVITRVLDVQVVLEGDLDVGHVLGGVGLDLAQQAGVKAPLAEEKRV